MVLCTVTVRMNRIQ